MRRDRSLLLRAASSTWSIRAVSSPGVRAVRAVSRGARNNGQARYRRSGTAQMTTQFERPWLASAEWVRER